MKQEVEKEREAIETVEAHCEEMAVRCIVT